MVHGYPGRHLNAETTWGETSQLCCNYGKAKCQLLNTPGITSVFPFVQDAFRKAIQKFNFLFAFTSTVMNYDRNLASNRNGVFTFRLKGKVFHSMGPLRADDLRKTMNTQVYFLDPDEQTSSRTRRQPDLRRKQIEAIQTTTWFESFFFLTKALRKH